MSTILVVDDEQPLRDVLTLLFTDIGHQVRVAMHGGHALALVAREIPDLVVSDLMMPVLDGAELCRRLKRDVTTRHIPVILMSAATHLNAPDSGADAFIEKPFDLGAMETLVKYWLSARDR